jgi:thioredoxin reductase (NADPH)
VILATGARPARLDIPGELEFSGQGVSYCVSCDGPLFREDSVVMLAGGTYAGKEAHELCELAANVTVVTLDDGAWAEVLRPAENLRVIRDSSAVAIEGDASGVRGVRLAGSEREWQVDARGVFVCAGYEPVSELVSTIVELDPGRRIVTDGSLETSVPGVYAVGDVRAYSPLRLLGAAADGITAATAIASRR